MKDFDKDLVQISEITKRILNYNSTLTDDSDISTVLVILVSIENIFDKGRQLLDDEGRENRMEINRRMDELRKDIRTIIDSRDKAKNREFFEQLGNSFKGSWSY